MNPRIEAAKRKLAELKKGSAKKETQQLEQEELSGENVVAVNADIADNEAYKIITSSELSTAQKIEGISRFLVAKDGNYEEARLHYAEFEAYFNYSQSQNMQINVQGIQRLIKEIDSALKPEIERIIRDVLEVQKGVDDAKRLLEVLRSARIEGKTIDEIKEALQQNDALVSNISALKLRLEEMVSKKSLQEEFLKEKEEAKTASDKKFLRKLLGPDKNLVLAVELAIQYLDEAKAQVEAVEGQVKNMESERNEKLESGPLLILRSIDATEKSFSDSIVATAKASLALIEGASKSTQTLLARTAYSEATAREINQNIAEAEVRQTILKGAIEQVSQRNKEETAKIKKELEEKDAQIGASQKGEVQFAVLNAERVDIDQQLNNALDYQEVLNQVETNFSVIAAGAVEARGSANQLASLIHTEKELLKRLGTEALPATTLALRTVLEISVAQQNSEMAVAIGAITERARSTGKDGLASLIATQQELHAQKIKDMDHAIAALSAAELAVVERIESTIAEGAETRERMTSLSDVASGLQAALGELNEIRPSVAESK